MTTTTTTNIVMVLLPQVDEDKATVQRFRSKSAGGHRRLHGRLLHARGASPSTGLCSSEGSSTGSPAGTAPVGSSRCCCSTGLPACPFLCGLRSWWGRRRPSVGPSTRPCWTPEGSSGSRSTPGPPAAPGTGSAGCRLRAWKRLAPTRRNAADKVSWFPPALIIAVCPLMLLIFFLMMNWTWKKKRTRRQEEYSFPSTGITHIPRQRKQFCTKGYFFVEKQCPYDW